MKLFKKLLPVATLASAVAVVTPLVTSCSAALASTSSFDYQPSAKHASDTISIADLDKINTITKEYFSDTNKFAQDIVYAKAQNYKEAKTAWSTLHSDGTFTFDAKVKNISIKEQKTLDLSSRKVYGYLIDYETEYSRELSFTLKNVKDEQEGVTYKEIKVTVNAHETDVTKNGFVYLFYTGTQNALKPTIRCALLDEASDKWEWQDHEDGSFRIDWTYQNGTTVTDVTNAQFNDYYSKDTGLIPSSRNWDMFNEYQYIIKKIAIVDKVFVIDYDEITTDVGSYYLSDIKVTL